ncbi:MAG: hypothetical protein OXP75_05270 [Rhodospirillales bacterium]|nr:hypothetical protein [Rhodospirillales bacterium]
MRRAITLTGPVLAIAAAAALAACGEPLHPSKWKDDPDEIPPGEGLLTGEDGAWTIYSE